MKKLFRILPIVIIGVAMMSCGSKTSQNENSKNASVQEGSETESVMVEKKEISSQTKAKIEKWKKEVTGSTKRLSANDFAQYDLSNFWRGEYSLGYIGKNFQRMYITFEKVRKISATEYRVEGFSQVKSNVCNFTGFIKNIEFNQYKNYWEDECGESESNNISNRGCLMADFILEEDPSQKSTGIFYGALESYWIIIDNGISGTYQGCGDGEQGDQFFGEWVSYKGGSPKPVAWGIGRIPFSGNLDNGASEFIPDKKYINNGWEEYKREYDY